MDSHDLIAGAVTLAAVLLTAWIATRGATKAARQAQVLAAEEQLDQLVGVVRSLTGTMDEVLDILKGQGVRITKPRYPRDWFG